jgi:iron complex outermembrane receptor protein
VEFVVKSLFYATALSTVLLVSGAAHAQRASENAVTSAQDAFGTTVGNESIGLYGTDSARGFSPVAAGNIRLEGLYFDRQTGQRPLTRWLAGSAVHVGLSAQSYPFAAPTGIANFNLRIPGDKSVTSVVLSAGPFDQYGIEVDGQYKINDKLSIGGGVGYERIAWEWGSHSYNSSTALAVRWRPTDDIEIVPFFNRAEIQDWEVRPFIFSGCACLPRKFPRLNYFSQDWADWEENSTNYGLLARVATWDNWTFRLGAFRSLAQRKEDSLLFYNNTQADGSATLSVLGDPYQEFGSYSGEARMSGVFTEGPRRHTVHFAFRGRKTDRIFGGGDTILIGPAVVGETMRIPKPNFNFRPSNEDSVKQGTGGIAYEGLWKDVGEFSFGIQKTTYNRTFQAPAVEAVKSKSTPWLYNGTLAAYVTPSLALYTSYTRGLEESGIAPDRSINRGEALPASLTKQVDAGMRYTVIPGMTFVGGVFEVKKPYYDVAPSGIFGNVGTVRHRGIELSLAGEVTEGLTIVAGAVLLQARVAGVLVDQGVIGNVPIGRQPLTARLNVQYGPSSWNGFSVDGSIENIKEGYANLANTLKLPERTVINLGGRYRFDLVDSPATIRAQVLNVTNSYGWSLGGATAAWLGSISPRRFQISLAVDF